MTDLERFEGRLAASLRQLAEEAPVDVDAVRLTQQVSSTTHGLDRLRVGRSWRLPVALRAVAQIALIAALLLALVAVVMLGQRMARSPYEGALTGQMACSGQPWTTTPPERVVLNCEMEVQDARLVGPARIEIGPPTALIAMELRHASLELRAADATWRGDLELLVSQNGTAAGDAALTGSGGADGLLTQLHVVSGDGVTWGVVGSMSATR